MAQVIEPWQVLLAALVGWINRHQRAFLTRRSIADRWQVGGELLVPETWRQLYHVLGRMTRDAPKDVHQVGERADTLKPRCHEQALKDIDRFDRRPGWS